LNVSARICVEIRSIGLIATSLRGALLMPGVSGEEFVLIHVPDQDHRAIKRIIRPMMGFKDFRCARIILSGIELMHMIRKGQLKDDGVERTVAAQFHALAIQAILRTWSRARPAILIATKPAEAWLIAKGTSVILAFHRALYAIKVHAQATLPESVPTDQQHRGHCDRCSAGAALRLIAAYHQGCGTGFRPRRSAMH
jgi:hypothetical protein